MLEASSGRTDLAELFDLVGRFRWRLGREQLLVFALRGGIGAAMLLAALDLTAWVLDSPIAAWTWAVVSLAPLAAIGLAVARWPSPVQAARTADHHLALAERLATAVELSGAVTPGRFDALQVRDAVTTTQGGPDQWPSLTRQHRHELVLGAFAASLALASLVLPGLPRPRLSSPESSAPPDVEVAAEPARSVPFEFGDLPTASSSTVSSSPADDRASDEQLAQRVQQAQSARQSLDRLASALGQVSAGQAAAEAIQRGDYAAARDQLANLGDEADQLSAAAKQQLSAALQSAASQTANADRQLADREKQASQALARGYYSDERQALRQLADQVQRSGQNSLSQAQLAREVGRLEQARGAGQQSRTSTDDSGQSQPGTQGNSSAMGTQGSANGRGSAAQQTGAAQGQSGQVGQGGGEGQQGGPGAGVGTTDPLGDPAARLDADGERVEVPVKLGPGPGERPATGDEQQVGQPNGGSLGLAAEQAQHQEAGQVVPETNLVPGERRPVIRGYFGGDAQAR